MRGKRLDARGVISCVRQERGGGAGRGEGVDIKEFTVATPSS